MRYFIKTCLRKIEILFWLMLLRVPGLYSKLSNIRGVYV